MENGKYSFSKLCLCAFLVAEVSGVFRFFVLRFAFLFSSLLGAKVKVWWLISAHDEIKGGINN